MTATYPAVSPTKSSTERQLELTINAIARSMRKAIRMAEKEDPAGTDNLWEVVEHRANMLQTMLAAASEYMRTLATMVAQSAPPATPAPAPVESMTSQPAQEPQVGAPSTAGIAAAMAAEAAASTTHAAPATGAPGTPAPAPFTPQPGAGVDQRPAGAVYMLTENGRQWVMPGAA